MKYQKAIHFAERETVEKALAYATNMIDASYKGHSTGTGSSIYAYTAMYTVYNTMCQAIENVEKLHADQLQAALKKVV
jgi:hypothetical protein